MRRRGYDVTALPADKSSSTHLSYYPFDVWKNAEIQTCSGTGYEYIQETMKKWGNGSRAQIVIIWKNTNSGHTFIAEQIDGKTKFVDPQNGKQNVSNYFDYATQGATQFCRIDNIEVSNKIFDCCKEVYDDKF